MADYYYFFIFYFLKLALFMFINFYEYFSYGNIINYNKIN